MADAEILLLRQFIVTYKIKSECDYLQGFLQGILTAAGSLARALGPLLVTQLFDHYGPMAAYLSQAASVGVATTVVFVFNRKFIQHIVTREFGVSY